MKKKLLIVVGAGASVEFGLPSISAVDQLLDSCADSNYPLANTPSNLYRYCRDAISNYYNRAPKLGLRKKVNFEEVLYQINLLTHHVSDPYFLHGSNALLSANSLPDVREFGHTPKPIDGHVLDSLIRILTDALVDYFIDTCVIANKNKKKEIAQLGQFLLALKDEFEIGIISLNYDDLLIQALPGLHTGFDTKGQFQAMSVLVRTDWNFIYHLHGSVHFAMTGSSHDMHDITWKDIPLKDHTVHAVGRNSQDSMEGTTYPMSPFVTGYGKTVQVLRQPFRTYFAQVTRLVNEADSLLFLGYGFGDLHLNMAFSEVRDRRRPVVVVDWAGDAQDPLPSRQDPWSRNLFKTLPGNAYNMSAAGHVAPAYLGDLKAAHELEISNDPKFPLAVWYNGMCEVCLYPQKILRYLV